MSGAPFGCPLTYRLCVFSLLVSCLKCVAHCDVSRDELVLLQLQGKLEKGELDARAGIIAGSILMNDAIIDGKELVLGAFL